MKTSSKVKGQSKKMQKSIVPFLLSAFTFELSPFLPNTNLPDLFQIGVAKKDFPNAVLLQRRHPILDSLLPNEFHRGLSLDQPFHLVGSHQEFMKTHTAPIPGIAACLTTRALIQHKVL
jgi:hypothetical protein